MITFALSNLRLILLYSLLVHFVDCVDEAAKEEILHASSYADAYQKYLTAFQQEGPTVYLGSLHISPEQRKEVEEKEKRKQRKFIKTLKQVNKHNKNYNEGISGYLQTVNQFTVMEDDERKMYTGFAANSTERQGGESTRVRRQSSRLLKSSLPQSVDWVKKGYVTKVKNQDVCASCWSFAAIVPLEYAYKKVTKNLVSLSEQELLDCTSEGYGGPPDGCSGNWPTNAWKFVYYTQTLPTMRAYPYKNKDLPCRAKQHENAMAGKFKLTSYQQVKTVDEAMTGIAQHGPLAVALFTANDFFTYDKGIYDGCPQWNQPTHAVAMVGYDATSWLVKNSWGEQWGVQGMMRLKRRNVCGCLDYAYYIIVEKVAGYVPKNDGNDESPQIRCQDKGKESENMHCAYRKTLGDCESKKMLMAKYCADTCNLCDYKPASRGGGGGSGGSGGRAGRRRGGGRGGAGRRRVRGGRGGRGESGGGSGGRGRNMPNRRGGNNRLRGSVGGGEWNNLNSGRGGYSLTSSYRGRLQRR